jgi:hypothetical protein
LSEPFQAAALPQIRLQLFREREKIARIVHGIFRHVPGQRALRPVGFLRAFGQNSPEEFLDQSGETELPNAEEPRRDHRIEDSGRDKIHASAQEAQIEIGALQDDFLVRQRTGQRRQVETGQRIDQVIVPAKTELHETKLFVIAVQTIGLGIDRDAIDPLQLREEFCELGIRGDHFNPLRSSSAFVLVTCRFSINFSIASIGGSAAMALRRTFTRSHSSGW